MADQQSDQEAQPTQAQPTVDPLEAAQAELAKLKGEHDQLRFTANRDRISLGKLNDQQRAFDQQQQTQQVAQQFAGYSEEQIATAFAQQQARIDAIESRDRETRQMMQAQTFQASHPKADTGSLHSFLQTPEGSPFVAYGADGQVDMNASYRNAQNHLDAQEFHGQREQREATADQRRREDASLKANAHISGSGGSPSIEPTVDLDNMTSDEMVAAGLLPIGPDDNFEPINPGTRIKRTPG